MTVWNNKKKNDYYYYYYVMKTFFFFFQNGNGNMHLNTFDCALQSPAFIFCIDTIILCSIKTHRTTTRFKRILNCFEMKQSEPEREDLT